MKKPFLAPDSPWHYALSLALGLAIVAWYAASLAHIRYHYTPDSAAYIEAARNLANGKLPVFSSPIDDQGSATAPLALFPPGFPLLIYSVSAVSGINDSLVSVGINWLSWALLPAILLFALRPVTNVWAAHITGILVGISPGATQFGWAAHSDILFLLLVISSFGLLLRGCLSPSRPGALFFSGLACGFAYVTRNAGVALIAAMISTFGLLAMTRILNAQTAIARFAYWLVGMCLVLIPFLAWNLGMFGSVQPYSMPPSDTGLLTNIRTFLQALLIDVSAAPPLSLLVWEGKALLLMVALSLIVIRLGWPRIRATWKASSPSTKLALIFLTSYLSLGSTMVVIARTRYQWGEAINLRHVLQYSWAILAVFALLVAGSRAKATRGVALIIAITLTGSRVVHGHMQRTQEAETYHSIAHAPDPLQAARRLPNRGIVITNKLKLAVAEDAALLATIRCYPDSTMLVSNFADVFQIKTGRAVLGLEFGNNCDLHKLIENLPSRLGTQGEIRIFISPDNGMLRSGCWDRLHNVLIPGYRATLTQPNLLTLASAGTLR